MAPISGRHSTIESPECVSRVMPPTTTIAKTSAQQARSHAAMARRSVSVEVMETSEAGIVPDPGRCVGSAARAAPASGGLALPRLALLQLLGDKVPVDELVDDRAHEFGAAVFIVDVVGVLPDVECQERCRAHGERVARVLGGDDLELAVARHEPCPAAAEAFDGALGELLLEGIVAAEVRIDAPGDVAAGLATALRLQAIPEERVVPG